MNQKIDKIIKESVRDVLMEMDIVPTNQQGEGNMVRKQSINAWRMIYNLMDNVKNAMKSDWQGKNGKITNEDVDRIIDYIYDSIKNITRNTIGDK